MTGKAKICILDYGSGNVRSIYNIIASLTPAVKVSNDPADLEQASHLVLPGVGAFGAAMRKIRELLPLEILEREVFERGKPFLGICVGMQVLAGQGTEFGIHDGLGWIPGVVRQLQCGELPLPHIGWNSVGSVRPCQVMAGLQNESDFYFVHSFAFEAQDRAHVIAETEYGERFAAIVGRDNIIGVQFHPEKSQRAGQRLLNNFILWSQ